MKGDERMSKYGEVWVEINLNNLITNLSTIKAQLSKGTKVLAVVKADAYGHGIREIAKCLEKEGIDYFGVASVEEALQLIRAGVKCPILLLRNTLPHDIPYLFELGIIPSISNIVMAREVNLYGEIKKKKMKIHIKIDTGNDSDGILSNEYENFFSKLKNLKWVEIEGIFTHISTSYGEEDELVNKQLEEFNRAIDVAESYGIEIPIVHAASSPAIFRYPRAHFNMVRVGTALYGLPFIGDEDYIEKLKPVMEIKSQINNIRHYSGQCSTGYGSNKGELEDINIAYIPIGYADALYLLWANRLKVLINGHFAEMYGHAFMDHIKVNITELSDVKVGDEVVILGYNGQKHLQTLDLAEKCEIGKVNCEVIGFLGNRVTRIYIENGQVVAEDKKC